MNRQTPRSKCRILKGRVLTTFDEDILGMRANVQVVIWKYRCGLWQEGGLAWWPATLEETQAALRDIPSFQRRMDSFGEQTYGFLGR